MFIIGFFTGLLFLLVVDLLAGTYFRYRSYTKTRNRGVSHY